MENIYDRVLNEIGNENKYQKRFDIIYHGFFIVFWGLAYMNIILALAVTPHFCKIPEKPDNVSDIDWKIRHIPRFEDIKGQLKFDSCLIYSDPYKSNDTEACHEYTYDNTWYDKTVPSENNWVCEKEINVANIMAYTKLGEVIGSIFFGWYSDIYGRRYAYIISITMLFVGRLISLLAANSYLLFLIGCLIAYLPSWTAGQAISVLSLEMSSARRRTFIVRLRFTSYSSGVFALGLLFWWIRDWKIFVIVTIIPLIPFLIMSWKMIESPRWLYTQGRVQESLMILKKIAKINKRKIEANTEKDFLNADATDKPQVLGLLMLFSTKRIALNTMLQLIIWVVVSLSYMQLLMSSGEKTDGNPFLDFAWQALIELPAVYIAAWLADSIGRRYTALTSIGFTGVMWTCIAIRENSAGGWIREWWIGSLFNIVARLSTTVIFFLINLLNMEFYPTCLRQTGMALGNVVSGVSSAVIPYVIYLGRRYDPRLPGLILTMASIMGVVASFILPETLNAKLPETLEEAQSFGCKEKSNNVTQLKPLVDKLNV